MNEKKQNLLPSVDVFDRDLIAKIKEEKISPKPRWHFLLKNYVVWTIGGLALLIGAASVSVLTYLLKNNDWGVRQAVHKSWGEFLLLTLPYFWLLFLGLFILIIYYNVKHTKRGYRYPIWSIIVASILASVVLGEGLFLAGLGEKIDSVLGRHAPFYAEFMNPQLDFWSNPEEGRLVGLPIESLGDDRYLLVDRNQKEWKIIVASSTDNNFFKLASRAEDMPPLPVRLIGEQISDQEFEVKRVMPLEPGRAFFERPEHKMKPRKPSAVKSKALIECQEKKNGKPCVLPGEGTMRSQPLLIN